MAKIAKKADASERPDPPQEADAVRDLATIARDLADPFPADAIGWKPQTVSGNRCLAVAYIDARDVMDRLDAVMGRRVAGLLRVPALGSGPVYSPSPPQRMGGEVRRRRGECPV